MELSPPVVIIRSAQKPVDPGYRHNNSIAHSRAPPVTCLLGASNAPWPRLGRASIFIVFRLGIAKGFPFGPSQFPWALCAGAGCSTILGFTAGLDGVSHFARRFPSHTSPLQMGIIQLHPWQAERAFRCVRFRCCNSTLDNAGQNKSYPDSYYRTPLMHLKCIE